MVTRATPAGSGRRPATSGNQRSITPAAPSTRRPCSPCETPRGRPAANSSQEATRSFRSRSTSSRPLASWPSTPSRSSRASRARHAVGERFLDTFLMTETTLAPPNPRQAGEPPTVEQGTSAVATPAGIWRWAWAMVVPAVVAIYLLVNLRFPMVLPGGLNVYLAQPAAWTGLALLAFLGWRYGLTAKPRAHPRFLALAALLGAFQISLTVIAGLAFGFGHSPYGHQAEVLAGNLLYGATRLVGVELSRALLICVVGRSRPLAGLLLG